MARRGYPDSLVGTDSATMINAWAWAGRRGIEAEAVMLASPSTCDAGGRGLPPDRGCRRAPRQRTWCCAPPKCARAWSASSSSSSARLAPPLCPTVRPSPTWRLNTALPQVSSPSTPRLCATRIGTGAAKNWSTWSNGTARNKGCSIRRKRLFRIQRHAELDIARSSPACRGRSDRRTAST